MAGILAGSALTGSEGDIVMLLIIGSAAIGPAVLAMILGRFRPYDAPPESVASYAWKVPMAIGVGLYKFIAGCAFMLFVWAAVLDVFRQFLFQLPGIIWSELQACLRQSVPVRRC